MHDVSRLSVHLTIMMAAGILACGGPPTVARRTCPVSGWRVQVTPDSLLDFCAPPDIVQVKTGHLWTRVDADSAGRIVRVETGRVTGGFYGARDKPMLEAAWLADSTRWVFVQGQARTDSALSELRAIVRTIRLRQ
jgi:hypothetical protein